MDKLVDVISWIHIDLVVIATILIWFVLFKDFHGYSSGIVDELRNIKSVIQQKRDFEKSTKRTDWEMRDN